jgi:splicing factor 3B subunit 3
MCDRHQGHIEVRTPLPRRKDTPATRGILITAGALYRSKDIFFFLVQSELGDLYKVYITTIIVTHMKLYIYTYMCT